MSERSSGDMLFSPLEQARASVVDKKPNYLELSVSRVENALRQIVEQHSEHFLERKMRPTQAEGLIKTVETKQARKIEMPTVAVELPRGIVSDARVDFMSAFPQWEDEIKRMNITYMIGYSKLGDEHKKAFIELLTEGGTLMSEAYPFYELLTQEISEKVAQHHPGIWGKIFGAMAKVTGYFTYRIDLPVVREWTNVKNRLSAVYGEEQTGKLISDMYFGDKDEYERFIQACESAKFHFSDYVDRAKTQSWYVDSLYRRVLKDPNILNNPLVVGGLNLPGRIHDVSALTIASTALATGGFVAIMGGLGNPAWMTATGLGALSGIVGAGIGAGGIGLLYHELAHVYGGNFRRKYYEMQAKVSEDTSQ